MKVTSKIVNPPVPVQPPPVMESVTLTLTPREAVLLALYLGHDTQKGRCERINDCSQVHKGSHFAPSSLLGDTDTNEVHFLSQIFWDIEGILEDAQNKGVS